MIITGPCCYPLPRYGIKGAVYLRSKDGQVAYVGTSGTCEWTSGVIDKSDRDITVNSVYGSQMYRLLDHLTVSHPVSQV